ncbi:hypothetical protein KVH22_29945 [Streptomyces olivaceus]|uniref:hypothetical protein n=1 Tax=Streptomyces TaxID=1883 RepID=UPI001CD00D33|nr:MULTISPECIES: hypothetical protein [Streptomyces]MBZ6175578.1 hypothetical protein [Streptomyces olivaceus]MBZ6181880.1 hypothetical protein [Streptomyces olivaceus]MBZ6259742.1 hypothetical protein [Streptomyces olivaceus]MCM8550049.1 hypothetical protein [Streptomyces sp. STCH 565 A]
MADLEDENMAALAYHISRVYSLLVEVCGLLPVPIGLPVDREIPTSAVVPAVQRVAALAKDQPMGETQEAQLFTGCIHFLAAIDLYALCATRYIETRAEGCGANLIYAEEALKDLARWLVINEAD